MAIPPNIRLGRYEIRSQLGAGGMGEVYSLAIRRSTGAVPALALSPDGRCLAERLVVYTG